MSIGWRKPCEHGKFESHRTVRDRWWDQDNQIYCPGGSPVTTKDLEEIPEVQILQRLLLDDDAYIGYMRPLDDEGEERLDAWLLVIDGRVEVSNAEQELLLIREEQ